MLKRLASAALLVIGLLAGYGLAQGGESGSLPLAELVARVQARFDQTPRLHARFQQETRLQGFEQAQRGEGQVWILRPGMMRWDYTKPERQTIIANGETLWIYSPEDRQVIRDRVTESLRARTPALFLAGGARLTDLFAVTGPSVQPSGEDRLLRLELRPQEERFQVSQVQLGIDPHTYLVRQVTLIDPLGNVTTMSFADIDTEGAVDPSLFQFEVPAGVDVVAPPLMPGPR
jgi:outer membrane lipoprotein carrier protein